MRSSAWVWIVILIIVIGGGIWWWMANAQTPAVNQNTNAPATSTSVTVSTTTSTSTSNAPMTATVTYNGTSFSPSAVTIKKGGTVSWRNSGSGQMWVASAQHPTHTVYDGTSRTEHCPNASNTAFDQCAGGSSYSFTFNKVGTWNYHDHLNSSAFGSVKVVE
ncbi:hypothetical protein HY970_02800 [Candidatus Kaiserbacteria bacterium]|nr:hypothetical protein [Candidatus Kaiserbacteria bacterium]